MSFFITNLQVTSLSLIITSQVTTLSSYSSSHNSLVILFTSQLSSYSSRHNSLSSYSSSQLPRHYSSFSNCKLCTDPTFNQIRKWSKWFFFKGVDFSSLQPSKQGNASRRTFYQLGHSPNCQVFPHSLQRTTGSLLIIIIESFWKVLVCAFQLFFNLRHRNGLLFSINVLKSAACHRPCKLHC